MEIKFKQFSIDNVQADLTKKMKDLIKSPALLSEIADVAIKDIKFQARKGVSTKTGTKFAPLSDAWVREREKIGEETRTNDAFAPKRSNITITGQLLDSMKKRIVGNGISIYFSGIHKPYKAKYLEFFTRRKAKRNVRLGKIKGLQVSHGGIEYVNTGKKGTRTIGKPIENSLLAQYVEETRPFFRIRESLIAQLKSVVIRYIRRKL